MPETLQTNVYSKRNAYENKPLQINIIISIFRWLDVEKDSLKPWIIPWIMLFTFLICKKWLKNHHKSLIQPCCMYIDAPSTHNRVASQGFWSQFHHWLVPLPIHPSITGNLKPPIPPNGRIQHSSSSTYMQKVSFYLIIKVKTIPFTYLAYLHHFGVQFTMCMYIYIFIYKES